jgi:uncharacterized protein (TIGR02996 family)
VRTFIYQDASSHRFWNIDQSGASFTVQYGRAGTLGRSHTKRFADEAAARRKADALIAEKLRNGYRETTPATPTGPQALRQALEDAINENPEDRAAHAAYADLLQDQGDPQGEFIQVQLALEDEKLPAKRRRELTQRESELLAAHRAEWSGDWVNLTGRMDPSGRGQHDFPEPRPCRFVRGLLAEIVTGGLASECARALAAAPQTRFVRGLYFGEDDGQALHQLAGWPGLGNLRVFQSGWTSIEEYGDFCTHQCHQDAGRVHELIARMPRLEELYLFACGVNLDALFQLPTLTHLRVLQIYHCWDYPLELLAGNSALTNLTHLLLHPKALGSWSESEAYITDEGVRSLLASPHLGKLTHLRLRLTRIGDAGCEEIVRSGILKRLKMLDLRHGNVTDAGARTLAACPDIKNLELLDLSRNALTRSGLAALRATAVPLLLQFQHAPNDEAFLAEGDYE